MANWWNHPDFDKAAKEHAEASKERGILERYKDAHRAAALHNPLGGEGAMRLYAKYIKNMSDDQINKMEKRLMMEYDRKQAADPAFKGTGVGRFFHPDNIGKFAVDMVGGLIGGADPTIAISPGKSIIQRILAQAGVNAAADATGQVIEKHRKLRDHIDPKEIAINAVAGAVTQGAGELGHAVRSKPHVKENVEPLSVHSEEPDVSLTRQEFYEKHSPKADVLPFPEDRVVDPKNAGPSSDVPFRMTEDSGIPNIDDLQAARHQRYIEENERNLKQHDEEYIDDLAGKADNLHDLLDRHLDGDQVLSTGELAETRQSWEDLNHRMEKSKLPPLGHNIVKDVLKKFDWFDEQVKIGEGSAERAVVDNTGYEKHTPYIDKPNAPANDPFLDPYGQYQKTFNKPVGSFTHLAIENVAEQTGRPVNEVAHHHLFGADDNPVRKAVMAERDKLIHDIPDEDLSPEMKAHYDALPDRTTAEVVDAFNKTHPDHPDYDPNHPFAQQPFDPNEPPKGPPNEPPSGGGGEPPHESEWDGLSPVEKLNRAIRKARPVASEQKDLLHSYRQGQDAKLTAIQQRGGSHFEELAALKGKAPTSAAYESIAHHFSPEDVKALEHQINNTPGLGRFDKFNAKEALHKLLDPEGVHRPTQHELHLLGESVSPDVVKALLEKEASWNDKAKNALLEISGLPRSLESSGDISFPFRQGIQLVGRPEFWLNIPRMLRMGISKEYHAKMMTAIKNDPDYQMMKDAGVYFHKDNGFVTEREEAFMGTLAEHMPGEKIPVVGLASKVWNKSIGAVVRGSDRAFTGYANLIRAASAKAMIRSSEKSGINLKTNDKALKIIGDYVNTSTGRGSLGNFEQAARGLSTVFFSPRLAAARAKMLNPFYWGKMYRHNPVVFKRAFGDLVRFTGFASTAMYLAQLAGAEVTTDPHSVDFGKIKIGKARFGLLGGFEQFIRLGFELKDGYKINADGERVELIDPGFGKNTRLEEIENFLRYKLAPLPGYVASYYKGRNPIGEKFDAKKEAINLPIPLAAKDIWDVEEEFGKPGLLAVPPILLGISGQVYKDREPSKTKAKNEDDAWLTGSTGHDKWLMGSEE